MATERPQTLADLIGAYLAEQCTVIIDAEAQLRAGENVIHVTRVAVRRLRSTIRVFDELFDRPSSEGGSGAWTKLSSVTADDLEPECEFAGLVQALFTPEVRAATEANGLIGWRIEGRDLIFTSYTRPAPASPDEIVAGTECLVALARLFPAEAAKLYGTPPTTDIPLPTRRGP